MGKAPAKPAAKAKGKATRGQAPKPAETSRPLISPTNRIVLMLALLALVPFSLPTLLMLFVGMLPTVAAAFAERGTARQAWVSVGGLNFAGLSNWLINLWFGHHTLTYAVAQLRTITPLLVAYAASALGWALYLAMPPLVNAVTSVTSKRRVVVLAAQQRKLIELWGEGVITRETPKTSSNDQSAPQSPNGVPPASATPARGRA